MDPEHRLLIIEAIEQALEGGPPVAVATVVSAGYLPLVEVGAKLLVRPGGETGGTLGSEAADETIVTAARQAFSDFPRLQTQTLYLGPEGEAVARRSQAQSGDAEVMLQLFEAPAKLVVVGGGHIGLALAQFGELLGYTISVLDDREAFANRERFPMAEAIYSGDMDEALRSMELDQQTYVVLVSRGHRQDELALRATVGRGAAYVGMIGSRRRTATVLRHLAEAGFDAVVLDEVSTPIGLDIGAETPEEIALSIFAEITMLRRGGTGQRMKRERASLLGEHESGETA